MGKRCPVRCHEGSRHISYKAAAVILSVILISWSGARPASAVLEGTSDPGSRDEPALVAGNTAFAFNLYAVLKNEEGNLFFSPFSISTALAMTYAGARGTTAGEMAAALRFSLPPERLHPVFAGLIGNMETGRRPLVQGPRLQIANALWGQGGYAFKESFIETIRREYGGAFNAVDFKDDESRKQARQAINSWVEDRTAQKIRNLIAAGFLTPMTRLVLVNAVYFKGAWRRPFDPQKTHDENFYRADGPVVTVPLMTQQKKFRYAETGVIQILELPYDTGVIGAPGKGGRELSMLVLLPKKRDGLSALEDLLTQENYTVWVSTLKSREVKVYLPKFIMTRQFELRSTLAALGIKQAFGMNADFSGIASDPAGLFISDVVHQAFVDVNEEGTEAAAATAVGFERMSLELGKPPVPVFRADHPFMFMIRDNTSGSILFMGRMMEVD